MKIQYGRDRLKEANGIVQKIVELSPSKQTTEGTTGLSQLYNSPECKRVLSEIKGFLQLRQGGADAIKATHQKFSKGVAKTPGANAQQALMYTDEPVFLNGQYTKGRSSPRVAYKALKYIADQIDERFAKMAAQISKEVGDSRDKLVYPWFHPVADQDKVLFNCMLMVTSTGSPFWDLEDPKRQVEEGLNKPCNNCLYRDLTMSALKELSRTGMLKMTEMIRYAFLQSVFCPAFQYIVSGHTEISDTELSAAFDSSVTSAANTAALAKMKKLLVEKGLIEITGPRDSDYDADQTIEFLSPDPGWFSLDEHAQAYNNRCGINGYFMDKEVSDLIKMALANLVI